MILDELGVWAAGLPTPGAVPVALVSEANLFLSRMPTQPDQVVVFLETPGMGGDYKLGGTVPEVEHPRIQVQCRDVDYPSARNMAEAVYRAADAVAPGPLTGVQYLTIDPVQPPFHLDTDEHDRVIIAFSLDVWKAPS